MKNITLLSTADIHFHRDYLNQFKASADAFIREAEESRPDLIILAGDTADRTIANTGNSEFSVLAEFIQELLMYAPVVTVQGTRSHDIPGSLDIFEHFEGNGKFTVLQPGYFYSLQNGRIEGCRVPQVDVYTDAVIVGIPEPNKAWLVGDGDISGEEARKTAEQSLGALLSIISARLEFVTIPKIGVFHGNITGASISDAQNLPSGGIELSPAGLSNLGLDYISCGHIHMRQEVAKNIWYEGSFFPKTWGEKDPKKFSKVIITEDGVKHESIAFPHPPMEKITIDYDEQWAEKLKTTRNGSLEGFRVWLDIRIPVARRGELELSSIKTRLIKEFCVTGDSRVSAKIITPETARAPEISHQKDLIEKFRTWMSSSTGLADLTREQIEKLQEIKEVIRQEGFNHTPKRLRLDSFQARGAIGIAKGQGKEELAIDLASYDPGIIALIGENGAGKSTFIDLCSPYPNPIALDQYGNPKYRKMSDLFYLKDSSCTKEWTEEVSGMRYKSTFLISPQLASPKTEFYLYQQLPGTEEWIPYNDEISGNKDPYEKAVNEVFGSVEMYRRSAYIPQGNSDLPATTKGRKELFNELVGFEYLEVATSYAKNKADGIEKDVDGKQRSIEMLQQMLDEKGDPSYLEIEIERLVKHIDAEEQNLEDLTESLKDLDRKKEAVQRKIQENEQKRTELKRADVEAKKAIVKIQTLSEEQERISRSMELLPRAKATIAILENTQSALHDAREDLYRTREESQKKLDAYRSKLGNLEMEKDRLYKDIQNAEYKKRTASQNAEILKKRIESGEYEIRQLNNPCENCGYIKPDVQEKISIAAENIKKTSDQLKILQNEAGTLQNEADSLQKKLETAVKACESFVNEHPEPSIDADTKQIRAHIKDLEKQEGDLRKEERQARGIMEAAGSGEQRILEIQKQITELEQHIKQQQDTAIRLKDSIDEDIDFQLYDIQDQIRDVNDQALQARRSITSNTALLSETKAKKDTIFELSEKIAVNKKSIQQQQKDVSDWRLLQRGLSRDGIQALELDALAPGIAAEANQLLERAYGEKFSIRFQTTKDVGSGSNRRQAEDFEVYVRNNEIENIDALESEQRLSTLSGGERIWILKSLYDAFGIIREQNTGLSFSTTFQDEADGALDPEKKYLYLQMVKDAHEASGRHHTLYITHDQSIRQAIDQSIVMERK